MTSAASEIASPVGVIAGGGAMPFAVADLLAARGIAPVLFALRGACDPDRVARFRHHWISVGQLGRATKLFRSEGCRDLIFIGTLLRPALSEIRLDWGTIRVIGHVMAAFRGGDDHLLSGIGRILEQDGFRMVGIRDVAPDILMPQGSIARATPDPAAAADIAKGREVLGALGPFDIGQAVVVIDGHVVAVEDIEGTDGLLARVARLREAGRIRAKVGRGVLVKAPKSSQDLRFDLPTVGAKTIQGVEKAGLAGIAVIAGSTIAAELASHDRGGRQGRPVHPGAVSVTPARATAEMERKIFLIATEESGDRLGANLMKVLRQRLGDAVRFEGVGGRAMAREGLVSLFPIEELSIIGLAAVVKQFPKILGLIKETAIVVTEASPDILVIIDSPDFTHRVARRVRAKDPGIPIVNYVSPSVWAWRPGRARAMLTYVDHVLALLPFEPEAYRRLRGPPCTYVGHPLTEQLPSLRPNADEVRRRAEPPPVLLVLPGSRRSEIRHHMAVFGQAVARLQQEGVAFELVLPTMPHLQEAVVEAVKGWPVQPQVVIGEQEKRAAFRIAHAALAKSGTVTLELALAGVPMVTAYRTGSVEAWILRRAIKVNSVILANLVIGENVVPEFLQEDCTPEKLAQALREVLGDSALRRMQLEAFAKIDSIMSTGNQPPSARAADIVLATMWKAQRV